MKNILVSLLILAMLLPLCASAENANANYDAAYQKIGQHVTVGKFTIGSRSDAYAEKSVSWIVCAVEPEKDRCLLVSANILNYMRYCYNDLGEEAAWRSSDVRYWLEGEFAMGFTEEELQNILFTQTDYEGTEDQFFLLSSSEVNSFFLFDSDLKATPTKYAATISKDGDWWLRSNGIGAHGDSTVEFVNEKGEVKVDSFPGLGTYRGVRPAMWVKLSWLFPHLQL